MANSTTMFEMKKLIAIFSTNVSSRFDKMSAHFIKLNTRSQGA